MALILGHLRLSAEPAVRHRLTGIKTILTVQGLLNTLGDLWVANHMNFLEYIKKSINFFGWSLRYF